MSSYLHKKLKAVHEILTCDFMPYMDFDDLALVSEKTKQAKEEYSYFLERLEENGIKLSVDQKEKLESLLSLIVLYDVYYRILKQEEAKGDFELDLDMYKMVKIPFKNILAISQKLTDRQYISTIYKWNRNSHNLQSIKVKLLLKSYKTPCQHQKFLEILTLLYDKFLELKYFGTAKYFLLMLNETAKSLLDDSHCGRTEAEALKSHMVDKKLEYLTIVLKTSTSKLANPIFDNLDRSNEEMLKLLEKEFPESEILKFPSLIKDFDQANFVAQQILNLCKETEQYMMEKGPYMDKDEKAVKIDLIAILAAEVYLQSAKFQKDEFVQAKLLQKAIDNCKIETISRIRTKLIG